MSKILTYLFGILLLCSFRPQDVEPAVQHLRCEMLVNPEGIDVLNPRLSWELSSTQRGSYQIAYQILVASSPEKLAANKADLWDSGKVLSDASIHQKLSLIHI
jgi:alpha-L-rhamnosidase